VRFCFPLFCPRSFLWPPRLEITWVPATSAACFSLFFIEWLLLFTVYFFVAKSCLVGLLWRFCTCGFFSRFFVAVVWFGV
jgi:hypothetical protein